MRTKNSSTNSLRKQFEAELHYRQSFEELLETISMRFIASNAIDTEIDVALGKVGSFISADRSYVFLFDKSGQIMSNTHEWCAAGIEPQIDKLQSLSVDIFPWWISQLRAHEDINFTRIDDLPPEAGAEREILDMQSIKSILVEPIEAHNKLLGFIGFDAVQREVIWSREALTLLRIISIAVSNALEIRSNQMSLAVSEKNFKLFFESITDLIVVTEESGQIIFSNQALAEKLGYSQQELVGMHVLDLHPKEKRQEAEEIFGAMLRGERTYCPLPLSTKSGNLFPAETRVWFGQWNSKNCIYGISKDLRAEHAALQLFERLFEQAPFPVAITSLKEKIFYKVNNAFINLIGYSQSELIGIKSFELGLFVKPDLQSEIAKQLIANGSVSNVELQVRKKDGSILDGLFSGTLIESQGQQFFLTVMHDVTETNRLKQSILHKNKELEEAHKMAKMGRWDYYHHNNNLIWSDTIYDIFEISKNDFGASYEAFLDTVHPDERNQFVQIWQTSLNNHIPYVFEHRLLMEDGRIKWVIERCQTEYDQQGQPVHSVGIVQDITERKTIEDVLSNTNIRVEALNKSLQERIIEVQAANQAKSQFLSNVSHELRTPLTSIIGLSELLQKQYYGKLNGKQEGYVKDILDSSGHLLAMINDILDLTKIEAGKLTIELTQASVKELIEDGLSMIREGAVNKNITVKVLVKKEIGNLTIQVDKRRFRQIIINLLSNAIKFTPSGGRVQVEVNKRENTLVFIISDTGIGINPEYQGRIFDAFYQIQSGLVSKSTGVGLGLSITKQLVEQHKGKIWVESEGEGKGSSFSFSIPIYLRSRETNGDSDITQY